VKNIGDDIQTGQGWRRKTMKIKGRRLVSSSTKHRALRRKTWTSYPRATKKAGWQIREKNNMKGPKEGEKHKRDKELQIRKRRKTQGQGFGMQTSLVGWSQIRNKLAKGQVATQTKVRGKKRVKGKKKTEPGRTKRDRGHWPK